MQKEKLERIQEKLWELESPTTITRKDDIRPHPDQISNNLLALKQTDWPQQDSRRSVSMHNKRKRRDSSENTQILKNANKKIAKPTYNLLSL